MRWTAFDGAARTAGVAGADVHSRKSGCKYWPVARASSSIRSGAVETG
jgi:hypothetical protein